MELMTFKGMRAPDARQIDDSLLVRWDHVHEGLMAGMTPEQEQEFLNLMLKDSGFQHMGQQIVSLLQKLAVAVPEREQAARAVLAGAETLKSASHTQSDRVFEPFDQWLKSHGDAVEAADAVKWLDARATALGITPATALGLLRQPATLVSTQRLTLTFLAGLFLRDDFNAFPLTLRGRVVRLMVVAALATHLAVGAPMLAPPGAVAHFLRDARIRLSEPLGRALRRPLGLVTRPGFADHYVVRTQWERYELGEIADIQTVLAGESRVYINENVRETRTERETSTEALRDQEDQLDREDRYELASAIREEQSLDVNAQVSASATMRYPAAEVTVNAGGGFDYSTQVAKESSTRHAKETIARAKTRVLDRKLTVQRQRELVRLRTRYRRSLDNTGAEREHLNAVYRWVDRIDRATLVRYPNRYLLEFVVPEPGAWLRYALDQRTRVAPPSPPPAWPSWLTSSEQISANGLESDYRVLASYFKAEGMEPPPEARTISATLVREPSEETWILPDSDPHDGDPELPKSMVHYTVAQRLAVPTGWEAIAWDATITTTSRYEYIDPDKQAEVVLCVGNSETRWTSSTPRPLHGTLPKLGAGEVPVVLKDTAGFGLGCTIVVQCQPTQEAIRAWQQRAYDMLLAAHRRARTDYFAAVEAAQQRGDANLNQLSPGKASEAIASELKRAILELLGERPNLGGTALRRDAQTGEPIGIDVATVQYLAPRVLFFEQAFEWPAVAYKLHPFYWGPSGSWERNAVAEDPNPELGEFLTAGSARVVVPVRPGFESDVQFFLAFGMLWGGGAPPAPDEPEYLSVAREIMDLQRGPPDGEVVESWPVRLGTSLVAIDGQGRFPIVRP